MITTIGSGTLAHQLVSGDQINNVIDIPSTIVLLIATALVLLMVPGLGIFYGGLERRKNVSTIIAQSIISIPIVSIIWIFGGFSLAFGTTVHGIIGNPADYFAFRNVLFGNGWSNLSLVTNVTIANGVPFIAFFLFQLSFAIITPVLVSGAFADRLKFKGYILFTILFTIFIYIPVCHWIWGGGWLAQKGAIDWAGGVVIHVTCGVAAIASVIVLKRRQILSNETTEPHSLPLVAIGATLLFFGWFGFNTGGATYSTFSGDAAAVSSAIVNGTISSAFSKQLLIGISAFVNSFTSMAMAMFIWALIDVIRNKHSSLLALLTAGVAGLATVTPTAGFVPIWSGATIGIVGGAICYLMCKLNHKLHFDDALEVWPVHGIGGLVGSILVAAFATQLINPNLLGTLQGLNTTNQIGSAQLLLWQFIMVVVVIAWTLVIGLIIFGLIVLLKWKTTEEEQIIGLDKALLKEYSYSKGIVKEIQVQPGLTGKNLESKTSTSKKVSTSPKATKNPTINKSTKTSTSSNTKKVAATKTSSKK